MNQLRYIVIGAAVVALIAVVAWWHQRQMVAALPPRIVCTSLEDAWIKAGPTAIAILGTGSMAPYLPHAQDGQDPLKTVVGYAKPSGAAFSAIRKGDLVVYWAEWVNGNVMHQAAQHDSGGWIMSGLHNSQSESFARVTAESFRAVIGEVYVW